MSKVIISLLFPISWNNKVFNLQDMVLYPYPAVSQTMTYCALFWQLIVFPGQLHLWRLFSSYWTGQHWPDLLFNRISRVSSPTWKQFKCLDEVEPSYPLIADKAWDYSSALLIFFFTISMIQKLQTSSRNEKVKPELITRWILMTDTCVWNCRRHTWYKPLFWSLAMFGKQWANRTESIIGK